MPGPAPRPRYPRATAPIRAAHFPRKLLRRGEGPAPETFRILAESGARIRTEGNAPIRTE